MMSRRVSASLIASLALASAASTARAQSASVLVRANGPDGASVVACLGDRLASWRVSAAEPAVSVEWQRPSACAQGSVRVLADGGAVFVDPTSAARALVRVSAEGAARFRVELSSPVWGEPLLVDRAIVLRLSDGVVQWRSISDGSLLFYRRTEAAGDPRALLSAGSPLLAQTRTSSVVCVPRARSFECWSAIDGRSTSDFADLASARSTSRALALDLDRDGDDELVVATEDGAVRAMSRAGQPRWTRSGPTRALVLGAPVAFYQGATLLVAWADVDRWVHVVDGVSGEVVQGFPRRSDGVSRSGVRVADVDGDGSIDVLVSERSGALSAFRVRDASAVSVGEGPSARAPIDGEAALVATGDGVVHWLAIDGAATLAHRALAATALGPELAVLVDQRDRRPVRVEPEIERVTSYSASAATVTSAPAAGPGSAPPRAVGCSATPALATEPRAWIALMLALLLLRERPRR
ncbi:MAG: hypothetical protein U0269_19925 [Polyangiales bacterium]